MSNVSKIFVSYKWNSSHIPDPGLGNHYWLQWEWLQGEAMLCEGKHWVTDSSEQWYLDSMAKDGCWKMIDTTTGDWAYAWGTEVFKPELHFCGQAGEPATLELFCE